MSLDKFPAWLQTLVGSLGGLGLFAVAFLDSSVLSLPIVNDLLVLHLSAKHPARMPYYALMATLGSLAGCICLYFIARKGGEVMFRWRAGARVQRIRAWVERNGFLSVMVATILPPPMPFKPFILAAGMFQVPVRNFVLALLVGRGFRYFGEGFRAVRYGVEAHRYVLENRLPFILIGIALLVLSFVLTRVLFRRSQSHP